MKKLLIFALGITLSYEATAYVKEQEDLYWAAREGKSDEVNRLLSKGVDPSYVSLQDDTPLQVAIRFGYKNVAMSLIDTGADVNQSVEGKTPLSAAAIRGDADIVAALIRKKANVDYRDRDGATALIHATAGGHIEVVEELLNAHANPNIATLPKEDKLTALHIAARDGQEKIVELLVANYADVNATDIEEHTPMFYANSNGHTNIVDMLKADGK